MIPESQIRLARKILMKALREDETLWDAYRKGIAGMILDVYVEKYPDEDSKVYEKIYNTALYGSDRWLTEMSRT